jgi:DNA polymerase-3 subunit chi
MTDVRFYHLQKQSLDDALPAILTKAFQGGHRILVRMRDDKEVERMNKHLWAFKPDVFLPHGSSKDGHAENQPIWLTSKPENSNNAKVLILTQGMNEEAIESYDLCCEMLDGRDSTAVDAARAKWKDYQAAGLNVTYWYQNERGGWEKKA